MSGKSRTRKGLRGVAIVWDGRTMILRYFGMTRFRPGTRAPTKFWNEYETLGNKCRMKV